MGVQRSSHRYRHRRPSNILLRSWLKKLAEKHPRYGYRRLGKLLRKNGKTVNHKAVYRAYTQEALMIRRRRTRKIKRVRVGKTSLPTAPNQLWAMDFVSDSTTCGQRVRTLAVIDVFTRECVSMTVDTSLPSARVRRALEQAIAQYGTPKAIRMDNGPEFTAHQTVEWLDERGILQDFIEPGKPYQNGHCESFNARYRDECLNVHIFRNILEARRQSDAWRDNYNNERPHSSLKGMTPVEFRENYLQQVDTASAA